MSKRRGVDTVESVTAPAGNDFAASRTAEPRDAEDHSKVVEHDEWFDYWETLEPDSRLFHEQSAEYVRNLRENIRFTPDMTILDYGCGFGYVTAMVAEGVGQVYAWDRSPGMRQRTTVRTARLRNVAVLSQQDPVDALTCTDVDLVLINSVVQYMTRDDFKACLTLCASRLSPQGVVLVSDMVPEEYSGLTDVADLLRFSLHKRFLLQAVRQGITDIGEYLAHRQARELTRHSKQWLGDAAAGCGLTAGFIEPNLTHFPRRLTAAFMVPNSNPPFLKRPLVAPDSADL